MKAQYLVSLHDNNSVTIQLIASNTPEPTPSVGEPIDLIKQIGVLIRKLAGINE